MSQASVFAAFAARRSRSIIQPLKRTTFSSESTTRPSRQYIRPTRHSPTTCQCQIRRFTNQQILRASASPYDRIKDGSAGRGLRALYKSNPVSVTLAFTIIIGMSGVLLYFNYSYWKYHHLHNYPEPVAVKLRRALYFTSQDLQPARAVEYFKQALEVAEKEGMDCWSDEVIGIKLFIAELMEKIGNYPQGIKALEVIMRDCLVQARVYDAEPDRKKDRTRLLRWTTAIGVKLGELYARPEVWDRDAAEERLSWAVETMLKERRRRDKLNITDEDEGPWISNEELAASIETMAHNYESQDQHYLAAPLFLHAINLHPQKTCHTVVLINNFASSLAQQSPRAAEALQTALTSNDIITRRKTVPVTRESLLQMAQTWAQTALMIAGSIEPPERNEECDVGCVVATHNLGEIAEMMKRPDEAKKRYHEAISLARAIGFDEGVEQSSERLRRLERAMA